MRGRRGRRRPSPRDEAGQKTTKRGARRRCRKRKPTLTTQNRHQRQAAGRRGSGTGPCCSSANAVAPHRTPTSSVAAGQRTKPSISARKPSSSAKTPIPAAKPRDCLHVSQNSRPQADAGPARPNRAGGARRPQPSAVQPGEDQGRAAPRATGMLKAATANQDQSDVDRSRQAEDQGRRLAQQGGRHEAARTPPPAARPAQEGSCS